MHYINQEVNIIKSYCYVVLSSTLPLDDDTVYNYVRNLISKYYTELEVPPYKHFYTKQDTIALAQRQGFQNLADFEAYLKNHRDDDGMENGLYYYNSTFNTQGHWDSIRLDGVEKTIDVVDDLPYSVITPDGVWHSKEDYEYKPMLDFQLGSLHPDNVDAESKWKDYMESFYKEYSDCYLAIVATRDSSIYDSCGPFL